MSRAFFAIGEFTFNMVKIWVAFDLVKAIAPSKRGQVMERTVQLVVELGCSALVVYNLFPLKIFLFSNNMLWTVVVVVAMAIAFLYKVSILKAVALFYLYWVAVHLVDFFLQSVVYYLLSLFRLPSSLLLRMDWRRGLYLLFFSVGCLWLGKQMIKNLDLFQSIQKKKWLQAATVLMSTVLLIYFQRVYVFMISEQYMTLWLVFWLALIITAMIIGVSMQKIRLEERERAQKIRLELLEANYEQATRMYKEKATLLHDEKHHMQVISGLLNQGNMRQALQYTEKMTDVLEKSGSRVWSEHGLLDLILNMKLEAAKKHQIDMDIKVDNMSGLNVEDVDLCALISNLLDNAIEANLKIADKEKRWIRFYGERKGKLWIINSSNPVGEAVTVNNGKLLTSKQDKQAHGYGTESIHRMLKKYSGDMNVSVEQDRFAITLVLNGFD